jgi:hypothetical protein
MDKAGHLLTWIVGGLIIATAAVAIAVSSTHRNAPTELPAIEQTDQPPPVNVPSSPQSPASAPAPAPAPVSTPATEPAMPAVQIQTATPPVASSGQIWECTINGLRTFSGKPCGDKSSLREISPVNRMDPTPALPYARSYEPETRYQPDYDPGNQQDSNPPVQEIVHNSYPVFIGIPVRERKRPDHMHRPAHDHYRVPPPPKVSNSH